MSWKRWLLIGVLLLALLLATPFIALRSETVTSWVLPELLRLAPGKVEAVHHEGALAGPLELRDIHWQMDERQVRIDRLRLDWRPFALLAGDADIILVEAGAVQVDWPAGESDSEEAFDPAGLIQALRLPVELSIERVAIDRFSLANSDALSGVGLNASGLLLGSERLGIQSAVVTRKDDRISLQASLALREPFTTTLSIQAGLADRAAIDGKDITLDLSAQGSLDQLQVTARLQDPATATLTATLRDVLTDVSWQGSLDIPTVTAAELAGIQPLERISTRLEFTGDPAGTELQGEVDLAIAGIAGVITPDVVVQSNGLQSNGTGIAIPAYSLDTRLDAELDWQDGLDYSGTLDILGAQLPLPATDRGRISDGKIEFSGNTEELRSNSSFSIDGGTLQAVTRVEFATARIVADADWQELSLPLGERTLTLATGTAGFDGKPADYRFSIASDFGIESLAQGRLEASGQGSRERIDATLDSLAVLDGNATGKVTLDIPAQRIDWSLDAQQLRIDDFLAAVSGRLGFAASGSSTLSADGPHRIRVKALRGNINNNTLAGQGRFAIDGNHFQATDLALDIGNARLTATGDTASGSGLEITASVPSINALDARFSGTIDADANWRRADGDNWIALTASGEDIVLPEFRASRAEVEFNLDAAGRKPSSLRMALEDARIAGRSIEYASIDASGTRADNRFDLSVQVKDGRVQLAGNGEWVDDTWDGRINTFEMSARNAGSWRLADGSGTAIAVTLGMQQVDIERFCLGNNEARLCAGASWDGQAWQASADLKRARLEYFGALLPAGLDYRGGFELHASARNTPELRASANVELRAGSVRAQRHADDDDDAEAPPLLEWYGGSANARLADRRINTDLTLDLGSTGRIGGGGTIGVPAGDQPAPLDISIHAALQKLDLAAALYPEINRIKGQLGADLQLGGTTDDPRVRGSAEIRNGSLQLARYGLDLHDIRLKLVGQGNAVSLDAGVASGDGQLSADLKLTENKGRLLAEGSVAGERFLATNTRELKLEVSPDLTLESDGREIRINGDLHIPLARIRPREISSGTVTASDDQVFVDAESSAAGVAKQDPLDVRARVRTTLGDDVSFKGFGLEADIEGALTVIREPDSPARGEGRLALVDGRYRAYGQRLALQRGELIYTGQPLTEPGLDIRATRQPAPNITVGVTLRGNLRSPELSLFSEPPMPQQEQLAWLILGRPASLEKGDQQQIDSASLALGLGGGAITSELRDRLDLEEATIQDLNNREEASLVLGKYLSPDLYVSYGIGLFEAANSFRIRYRLSSKWTLEAVSGLENSADFLYTIERGGPKPKDESPSDEQ